MDNYRPISILPVISKIAEKAVNVQLQQYLRHHGLLNAFQSGFRRHHSTLTAVTYFCESIRRSTDAGKLTGALFIDLKKRLLMPSPMMTSFASSEDLVWRKFSSVDGELSN